MTPLLDHPAGTIQQRCHGERGTYLIATGLSGDPTAPGMLSGWQGKACAEYVAARPDEMAQKPESLSFEEAAALPLATSTALQALRDKAKIKAGFQVCINGASGGVGTMAVQVAKFYGASVTAISSAVNHEILKSFLDSS